MITSLLFSIALLNLDHVTATSSSSSETKSNLPLELEDVPVTNKSTKTSGLKYVDDCTLPDEWRNNGLEIVPTQYLSYLERRVKSGYAISVSCSNSSKTFMTEIRDNNKIIENSVDNFGYIKVYCDTKVFSPDIFFHANGSGRTQFCAVGCTGLGALDSTLYNITYPPGGTSSSSQDPPIKYVESKSYSKEITWETDPETSINITCKAKFTRPVNDEGADKLRCRREGGFEPGYATVHQCKPGCADITDNNVPGLILTKLSKAPSTRPGNPPFAFSEEGDEAAKVTFRCLSSYQMIMDEANVEQSVHWCSKEKLGWYPADKPVCKFVPAMSVSSTSARRVSLLLATAVVFFSAILF